MGCKLEVDYTAKGGSKRVWYVRLSMALDTEVAVKCLRNGSNALEVMKKAVEL